jgi:hypothetical protein
MGEKNRPNIFISNQKPEEKREEVSGRLAYYYEQKK